MKKATFIAFFCLIDFLTLGCAHQPPDFDPSIQEAKEQTQENKNIVTDLSKLKKSDKKLIANPIIDVLPNQYDLSQATDH